MAQMRIFVSHSHEDDAFCGAVVEGLRRAGADVWYDEHNLGAGQLMSVIQRELGSRPVFVLILSKAAFASRWVRRETGWAFELQDRDPTRILLPVTAGPIERSDFSPENEWLFLHDFKRIEAPSYQPYPTDEAVRRLLRTLALTPPGEPPIPTTPQPAESVADLIAHGRALIAQNKKTESIPFFERATQLSPASFDAWANLGYVYGEFGRWQDCLDACERALNLNDMQAWVWSNKGSVLNYLGHSQEALAACEQALALDPSYAAAWTNKGSALDDLGRHEEALAAYEQRLAFDSTFAQAWNGKGMALLGLKRYHEAAAAADRALALDPADARIWDTKGQILNAERRFDDALLCINRALSLDANLAEVWHSKATALRGLGRDAEAEEAERKAKELGWKEQ